MYRLFIGFFLLSSSSSLMAHPSILTFDTLAQLNETEYEQWQGKEIAIRGFLYRRTDGKAVLASLPNLKSCCVGTTSKIYEQIQLKNDLESIADQHVVNVQGRFKIDPVYDQTGELVQLYWIESASIAVKNTDVSKWTSWVIVLIGLLVVGIWIVFKYRRAHVCEEN